MIEKEVRALLPAWTAYASALLAAALGVYPLTYLGVPLYLIALATLGALSMGHEYACGTLGMVLTLPVPRWRIWMSKLAVLLPMLATLAALAAWGIHLDRGDRTFGTALFWLPALAALFITPWLTMLTRSPLAGTVFTIGIVGGSMAIGEWIGIARHGFTREVDAFRVAFVWWSLGTLSFVGAVAGWRMFSRLEVVGDRGADVQLLTARPTFSASSTTVRRRHPFVVLFRKELRLQQLAFVVAAIYAAASIGPGLSGASSNAAAIFSLVTMFYMISMPAVIGSLAGGEERQFGTHDAQLLLPMKTSTQWIVKAAMAIGLSLIVALLMPAVLTSAFGMRSPIGGSRGLVQPQTLIIVLGCASVSLYVSTLARSGLMALVYSIGAIVGVGYVTLRLALRFAETAHSLVIAARGVRRGSIPWVPTDAAWIFPLAGFVLLVLWLALTNYRYSDRPPARVALHAAAVTGAIAACAVALGVISAL